MLHTLSEIIHIIILDMLWDIYFIYGFYDDDFIIIVSLLLIIINIKNMLVLLPDYGLVWFVRA